MRELHILLLICLVCPACVSNSSKLDRVTTEERQGILDGAILFPGNGSVDQLPEEDVFGLSREMIAFIDDTVSGARTNDRKITRLLKKLLITDNQRLQYDETATFTARDAFRNRRANCLTFTTLIVPMLRYLGLNVEFNEVDVPPVWNLQNRDTLILYKHVNAVVTRGDKSREVIDINMEEYAIHYPQRTITDQVAEAQYYNNRAMEFLLQENYIDTFRYLRKAIDLAPDVSFFWVNLGVLYHRKGWVKEAEIAFRQALEIEPGNLVAISNAERLYAEMGKTVMAEQFRSRAAYYRRKNPYYLYSVAMDLYVQGDYETAMDNIRAAIRRFSGEHRFFFLEGAIYQALGDMEQANTSLNRALELTSNQEQLEKYRRKMDILL